MHNELIKGWSLQGVKGGGDGDFRKVGLTLSNVKLYAERRLAATEIHIMSSWLWPPAREHCS